MMDSWGDGWNGAVWSLYDINKNEEEKSVVSVTCWTCHKGHPHVEEERPKE